MHSDSTEKLLSLQDSRSETLHCFVGRWSDATGGSLRIEIAYDDERVRNTLIKQMEELLGTEPHPAGIGDHRTYLLPGLTWTYSANR